MSKLWIFFKLRMLQLRYDKTALFFSYFLPVLMLLGIGYPMEISDNKDIEVYYVDQQNNEQSKALLDHLSEHDMVSIISFEEPVEAFKERLSANKLNHFLLISKKVEPKVQGQSFAGNGLNVSLYSDNTTEHKTQSMAVGNLLHQFFQGEKPPAFVGEHLKPVALTSYIVTLLPGLIGMTLLIVGLMGFGGVLIEEEHGGIYKNIKTIDASPIPFLGGLFLSRLLICYTMAVGLYIIGVFMFDLPSNIDGVLLFVILTLGCISFLGIGLVVSILSPSVNSFNSIVTVIQIPFLIFSGVFFSISAFPDWLQIGAQVIPLTHMNMAIKAVLFDGVTLGSASQIGKELIVMSLWCLGSILIAWKKFKW